MMSMNSKIRDTNMQTKVIVIGLDGATFRILLPWIKEGKLPLLRFLIENGAYGNLEVFFPTLSPLEWTCFYTGVNPGKLGIFAVYQLENPKLFVSSGSIFTAKSIKAPSIWRILSYYGKKVGVMNIPGTYPPERVNGFLISGILSPSENSNYFYPPELKSILKSMNYKIDLGFIMGELPDKNIVKEKLLKEQIVVTKRRVDVALKLINIFNPDFFAINFKGLDNIQHLFWRRKNIILLYLMFLEKQILRLCECFKPTHIIVLSDHGFHEAESKYFYINTFLYKKGYLARRKGLLPFLYLLLLELAGKIIGNFKQIRLIIPEKLKWNLVRKDLSRQIDYEKSIAYASMWGVFISKKLSKQYYNFIKQKIKRELEACIDPETKERVLNLIIEKESIYNGNIKNFPDLILVPNHKYMINPALLLFTLFSKRIDKPYLEGAHKSDPYGILIIYGRDIKKNYVISDAKIIDVAPTILRLYDIPIPKNMDGKVLTEVFYTSKMSKILSGGKWKIEEVYKEWGVKYKIKNKIKVIRERLRGLKEY